jgi:hypothetical protein
MCEDLFCPSERLQRNMYVGHLETRIMEEVTARLCDPVSTAIPLENIG